MLGIKNGMVMQRNTEDVCEIHILSEKQLTFAEFSGAKSGKLFLEKEQSGYLLTGIPVGGPYTVSIEGQEFSDIYVGDVWILAGQSNMEGVGWLTDEDKNFVGFDDIRALYMNDEWGRAKHRLHRPWQAVDRVHIDGVPMNPGVEPERRGVGPGLSFALKMKETTNVPQGVICCAHGGTTLEQWSPDLYELGTDKSLFAATIRRFKANGSHIKGIFWYQGCSEAMALNSEGFAEKTAYTFKRFRDFFGMVPILQVQIGNTVLKLQNDFEPHWMSVRKQQSELKNQVELLETVSAVGLETDDIIHLSSASQKKLGSVAAETMCSLLYGKPFLPYPTLKKVSFTEAWLDNFCTVAVEYENIYGNLTAQGKPSGFDLSICNDHLTHYAVCNTTLKGNTVLLRTFAPNTPKGWYLFYGFGINPYCNITDEHGRILPAIGPIKIC